jgi:hypothetical protein
MVAAAEQAAIAKTNACGNNTVRMINDFTADQSRAARG